MHNYLYHNNTCTVAAAENSDNGTPSPCIEIVLRYTDATPMNDTAYVPAPHLLVARVLYMYNNSMCSSSSSRVVAAVTVAVTVAAAAVTVAEQ